jgi:hypothetical protein
MVMINSYEELIIKEISSSLTLDLANLRWFPIVPLFPKSDCELFNLLDIIPKKGFIANVDDQSTLFSKAYGQLLDAQKDSFAIDIARKNYAKEDFWLKCNTVKTPIFKPDSAGILTALSNGASFDFTFDSKNYPPPKIELFPSYPNLIIFQPFLDFNEMAREERFVFKLHFDKIVHVPIRFGSWFNQGVFVKAFTDKGNWMTGPNLVTWDELFGANGVLTLFTNGLLVASGMTLEIQSFAKYDLKTLLLLKSNLLTSVWPFYLNPEDARCSFDIGTDGSITIKVTTSKSKNLLLAMEAMLVDSSVSGS